MAEVCAEARVHPRQGSTSWEVAQLAAFPEIQRLVNRRCELGLTPGAWSLAAFPPLPRLTSLIRDSEAQNALSHSNADAPKPHALLPVAAVPAQAHVAHQIYLLSKVHRSYLTLLELEA